MRVGRCLLLISTIVLISGGPAYSSVHYADSEIFVLDNVTSVSDNTMPSLVSIVSAHPNPFNPRTTIGFEVGATSDLRLAIYDLQGRVISSLLEGRFAAGYHEAEWQGVDRSGHGVPSGVYFCRLVSGNTAQTCKLVLVR